MVQDKGFNPLTAINLVSTCRDEICRPFTEKLDAKWGEHFSISSLGGMVFCGKTGFGAGMAHSPIVGGKERYVFWVGPTSPSARRRGRSDLPQGPRVDQQRLRCAHRPQRPDRRRQDGHGSEPRRH